MPYSDSVQQLKQTHARFCQLFCNKQTMFSNQYMGTRKQSKTLPRTSSSTVYTQGPYTQLEAVCSFSRSDCLPIRVWHIYSTAANLVYSACTFNCFICVHKFFKYQSSWNLKIEWTGKWSQFYYSDGPSGFQQ